MYCKVYNLNIDKSVKKYLLYIINIFKNNDIQVWLVGGCVRDLLLGKKPNDYDLCFAAPVKTAVKIFTTYKNIDVILTGLKHGTITLHIKNTNYNFECTMLRAEKEYSDGRHPDTVTFTSSLEEDLKRRDFTINSFAYNLLTHEVLALDESYFDDLEYKIVKTVGDPAERFEEDALRMLRAIRFAAQLNFSIETYTYRALSMCAPLLAKISKERIRDELTKILLSDNPQYLEFIVSTGLETYMFDGDTPITDMVNCEHQNPWHYTDVFHHTMDVVKNVPKTFEMRWAALFHDIGKPAVKKLKDGTVDHYRYIGHPEKSAEIALKIMDILKFSNDQKELIHKFVLYHDYPLSDVSDKKFKQKLVEIGEENFLNFLLLRQADALAHKLEKSVSFAIDAIYKCKERFVRYMLNPEPLRLRDLAVNGDDLKELGLTGKTIGETLNYLLDEVLSNPNKNNRETLLKLVRNKIK